MKDKRIGIVFFGIPRFSDITIPNIIEKIITPAGKLGKVIVRYHLYDQDKVVNPRNQENHILSRSNYDWFLKNQGLLETNEGVTDRYDFQQLKSYGDPFNNDFVSLKNLILQLHSLARATDLIVQEDPDIAIFLRPDLVYLDHMGAEIKAALSGNPLEIRLPNWQCYYKGYNDRFSIAGKQSILPYGKRIEQIQTFLRDPRNMLESERLVKFALDKAGCRVVHIGSRAVRIRIHGIVVNEDFKKKSLNKRIRYACYQILESLLRRRLR